MFSFSLTLTLLAGILAAAAMAVLLYSVRWLGMSAGDMIRAIGSYMTRSSRNAFAYGLVVYLLGGAGFAVIYVAIWSYFGFTDRNSLLLTGAAFGLVHGFLVSFWLVVLVAEHHSISRYRRVGFLVAISNMIGHVVYGAVLALLVWQWGVRLHPPLSALPFKDAYYMVQNSL